MTDPIQIRMAGYGPAATGFSKSLKFIGDRLEAEFGGRVAIEYIWNVMDHGYKAEQILVHKRRPETIPVETLTRFSLQVRMDVAEQLKLPPPLPMFNYAELIVPKAPGAAAAVAAPVPAASAASGCTRTSICARFSAGWPRKRSLARSMASKSENFTRSDGCPDSACRAAPMISATVTICSSAWSR